MSMESLRTDHDPRSYVARCGFFTQRPAVVEEYLWELGLPTAAERVFWFHWREGMRAGDWCSSVPIKVVATRCRLDVSTVTRAYQVLKAHQLLRRESAGRDPNNPFQQATAVTEVRLPSRARDTAVADAQAHRRPASRQACSRSHALPRRQPRIRLRSLRSTRLPGSD